MVTRKAVYSWKLCWIVLLTILQTKNVEPGPTRKSHRIMREIYPEIEPENDENQGQVCIVGDVVYGPEEAVPAEQPCLKCKCQPPGVQCETIKCAKKSGCKAIHRVNKCCPDYQCECHHQGKIYGNGEKLETSSGECKVCYCRGGEIQCTEVSCYIRTDCEAKTVPGQCCPKYDHCPPKEPLSGRPTTTESSLPNFRTELLELWPVLKNATEEASSPNYETQYIDKEENAIKITRSTQTNFEDITQNQPKITIQEIIPEIKEIPVTVSANQQEPPIEEEKDLEESDINDLVTDTEPDSSEISEVFQQPPPVLRIGDKLLFLKQGQLVPEKDAITPTSVITIIGAEGLQRGFEESMEEVPSKSFDSEHSLFNNSNDLEPKTSESTHILSLVKHKRKPSSPSTSTSVPEEISENTTELVTPVSTLETTTFIEVTTTEESVEDSQQLNNPKLVTETDIEANHTNMLEKDVVTTETTTEESRKTTTSDENMRSMESLEETLEDSGENTTPKDSLSSFSSTEENASVESLDTNSETDDMLQSTTTMSVQILDSFENQTETTNETRKLSQDVEIIDVYNFTGTTELSQKFIDKRESSSQDETDLVFKQLEAELNVDHTERTQTPEEEREESGKIFQELLEETSTPKMFKKGDKDAEMIQRVTEAIAKLTLRRGRNSLDANLLGVISNFFGNNGRK